MPQIVAAHRKLRRPLIVALLAASSAGLVGCENGAKEQIAALEAENQELRDRNNQLNAALDQSESQIALLQQERGDLESQLMSSRNRPGAASTGFENIQGVGVERRAGEISVGVAGDVLFDSGKATLKSTARSTLDQIASVLNSTYASNTIRIEGHTDSDPIRKSGWKTNDRLGAERALAVQEYLTSRGVSKARTYVASFGESRPRGNKSQSRRVEIVVLSSGG